MSVSSGAPTTQRPQRALIWVPLFVLLAWLTWQTIGNHVDLGIVEPATRVAEFGYVDGVEVAFDRDGRVIEDWQRNNPADDIIKALLALATLVALEESVHALTGRRWLSVLLAALSVPLLVAGGYWLTIAVYGLF